MKRARTAILIVLGGAAAIAVLAGTGTLPGPLAGDDRYVADDCTPSSIDPNGNFEEARFPVRADLPGTEERVVVVGHVLDSECRGVPGAVVKFWAAVKTGEYTDDSYGSVVSGKDGSFRFSTHYPGAYPDGQAAPHIHVMTEIQGVVVFDEVLPRTEGTSVRLELVGGGVPPPSTTVPPVTVAPGPEPFLP